MRRTKITLVLSLCIMLVAYASCTKETPKPSNNGPAPCDTKTWYEDLDGDGKGNPNVSQEHCDQPAGYVLDNTDVIDEIIVQKQVPILVKFMGETCGPCGGWGWAAWENLYTPFVGKAFSWSNYGDGFSNGHFRSEELNPTMDQIEDRFFSGGKPSFLTNNTDYDQSTTAAENAANTSLTQTADVSAVLNSNIEGDQLTINTQVKFFNDLSGEYYVAAYLVEEGPVAYQAGHPDGANTKHHRVMRGSLSSSAWGEQIVAANASAGDEYTKTFTATIPSNYNKDNFSYGVVIWKKVGQVFLYVNAYSTQ